MSNPTPTPTTPAAPARSAREVIKAHVEACERWAGGPEGLQREATAPTSGYISAMMRTALPLRALLDAPTGAVEKLVKAARDIDETLRADAMPNGAAHLALVDAITAVRASPEAVGAGEGPSDAVIWENRCERLSELVTSTERERDEAREAFREASALRSKANDRADKAEAERDQAVNERDAAQKQFGRLAKAVRDANTERDALKADLAEANRTIKAACAELHAEITEEARTIPAAVAKFKAELAAARGEVERLRSARPITDHAFEAGARDIGWQNQCAFKVSDEPGGPIMRCCGAPRERHAATSPPASEAISERARWIAVIATIAASAEAHRGPTPRAEVYLDRAAQILAASERAAKGEGANAHNDR